MPDQKNKADAGKSNPLLLEVGCAKALEVLGRVLDYGYEKYVDPSNPPPLDNPSWRKVDPRQYDAAARRHRRDRDKGQTRDVESNLIHLAHEAINLLFQIEKMIEANPGVDFLTYNPPPRIWMGEQIPPTRIWMGEQIRNGGPKLKDLNDFAFKNNLINEHLFRRPEVGVKVTSFGPADMPQGHGPWKGDGRR